MTVSLPKPLRSFVAERVEAGGYGSVSDYIRELIRRDQRDAERAAFERTLADASLGLSKLSHVPPEAWQELQASISRGEELLMSARFAETLELMKTGILLTREKLRREFPKATDAEIERRLAQWLHERSDKGLGDGPGRPVSEERLRRILGT
jgi:antitoxin ParD1/3/4